MGFPGSPKKKQFLSPRDEEERRRILKSLVAPNGNKTKHGEKAMTSFDSMILKAARSAENLPSTDALASPSSASASKIAEMFRKESSLSLQIPGNGLVSPSGSIGGNKKVTFSQVVDQMACSLSDSSSLSDLSCAEDFKLNVSSSVHVPNSRRSRKLFRSGRLHSKRKSASAAASGSGSTAVQAFYQLANATSGSEDVYESSMESIESSTNSLHPKPLAVIGSRQQAKQLHKISSADSLLSMIKTLKSSSPSKSLGGSPGAHPEICRASSTPTSPQLSDEAGMFLSSADMASSGDSPTRLTAPPSSPSQIKVEIHDHPSSDSSESAHGPSSGGSGGGAGGSGGGSSSLTLDVPGFPYGLQCLSPIKELPSPLPTPLPSPLPCRSVSPGCYSSSSSAHGDGDSTSPGPSTSSATSARRSSFRSRFSRKKSCPAVNVNSAGGSASGKSLSKSEDSNRLSCELHSQPTPIRRRRSVSGDGTTLFEETSFVVPAAPQQQQQPPSRPSKSDLRRRASLVPTITLTMHDSSEDLSAKEKVKDPKDSQIPNHIVIPQLFVTEDSAQHRQSGFANESATSNHAPYNNHVSPCRSSAPVNANHHPLSTVPGIEDKLSSKNYPKDTSSKPSVEIELRESHPSSPSDPTARSSQPPSIEESREKTPTPPPLQGRISPTQKRPLFKQQEVRVEDEESLPQPPPALPQQNQQQLLAAPFDSTPRSRSQSVELPEFRVNYAARANPSSPQPVIVLLPMEEASSQETDSPNTSPQGEIAAQKPTHSPSRGLGRRRVAYQLRRSSATATTSAASPMGDLDADANGSEKRTDESSWKGVRLGSPPMRRDLPPVAVAHGVYPMKPMLGGDGTFALRAASPQAFDKPNSLDLLAMAPAITVTPMSEVESDSESPPAIRVCQASANVPAAPGTGMHYLSPFTIITSAGPSGGGGGGGGAAPSRGNGSRTTSESNLSSSGYSSMASPSTSRNGSSNPLCTSESEEVSTPTKLSAGFFASNPVGVAAVITTSGGQTIPQGVFMRRPSPLLKSPSVDSESSDPTHPTSTQKRTQTLRSLHEKANALRSK